MQVCPTGIDIRNGLQYECIGCAACIDGCNQVMDKMSYPRGLIRYSTENAIVSGWQFNQMISRAFRPRVLVYAAVLGAVIIAAGVSLYFRVPLKVDVIRDRASLSREVDGGVIENVYRLQIMNTEETIHIYRIQAIGLPDLQVAGDAVIEVPAASTMMVPIRLRLASRHAVPGTHRIEFHVQALESEQLHARERSIFMVR